ncbi:MAG: ester cyclase [Dehalococcoidia bacterium]
MSEDIRRPVIRYFEEVLNDRKPEVLDDIFASDFVNEVTGFPPVIGIEAMRNVVQSILDGFPDCHSTIEDIMAIDDKVIVCWAMTGTHHGVFQNIAPTGKTMNVGGILIDVIEQQKIAKRWAYNSFPSFIQQLRE